MYSCGPLHMAEQKQGDQLEPTYGSSGKIRGVALRTRRKRWMTGRNGERGSGISVLIARHDDNCIYIYTIVLFTHLQHHNDTIIKQTQGQDATRKTQEDFFMNIFTSRFITRVRKGCSRVACERMLETEHKL